MRERGHERTSLTHRRARAAAEHVLGRSHDVTDASIDELRLVHRGDCDVYQARAGSHRFVLHTGPEAIVGQLHDNLVRLEAIGGEGLPRAIGWAPPAAEGTDRTAVLVSTWLAGAELSARTFGSKPWSNLCRLLLRLHGLPAEGEPGPRRRPAHDPCLFPALAADLEEAVRTHRIPIPIDHLREHLGAMTEYANLHSGAFRVRPRLIHTDLSRSNVVVDGPRAGIVDWMDLGPGDYAYDLASLKFAMDSVRPRDSAKLLQQQAREYRAAFDDSSLEKRMRFFLALPALVRANTYARHAASYPPGRAWRVRTCYLHSVAQWRSPLRLDGEDAGAPAVPTDHRPLPPGPPLRALFYLAANRRAV